MSHRHLLVLVLLIVFAATQANAQTTHVGTASPGAQKLYSFTPAASGQFTATLSWDVPTANLFLVVVCGTSNPLTFGVAGGSVDRFARLEAGLIGTNPCVIGVSTFDVGAAYRLNLQHGANQASTPQFTSPVAPTGNGMLDALLVEHANRTLAQLKLQMR